MMLYITAYGQNNDSLEVDKEQNLQNVTITSRRAGTKRMAGPANAVLIGREELFKAACCNLGESFTTNPSVDVNYSDAATGAKQIKLLGLSGATASNLFTITPYNGYDPEVSSGTDSGAYPASRTFTFGVNVTL